MKSTPSNQLYSSIHWLQLTPIKLLIVVVLSLTSFLTKAELKTNSMAEIHLSANYHDDSSQLIMDKALLGFRARTPEATGIIQIDAAETDNTDHLLYQAYANIPIGQYVQVQLGKINIPYGIYRWNNQDLIAFEDINQRLGLYQSEGINLQLRIQDWQFDLGGYNPADRSEFISSDTKAIESISNAPLYNVRLRYYKGRLINIQTSYAQQHYFNHANSDLRVTEFFSAGIDFDISPLWGVLINYNNVSNIAGKNNNQANWKLQFDWHPSRFWDFSITTNEVFDNNNQTQLLLLLGVQYHINNHNQILATTNINGNNKDYTGFLGDQSQALYLQYRWHF